MAEAKIPEEGAAIGIDLGTTFSCVSVVRNGNVEIIPNELGKLTTPSFVAFNEHERMIGDTAKRQLATNSANTIFDAKRLIGRKFNDPIVQKDMQQWPFKVVEVNKMPKMEVQYLNEMKRFSAEEISAMILGKMKEIAEKYLNAKVKNAVVTVPAYFNDMQRKATKDAAKIAGLNVLRIVNEPTAAAIAYGLANDTKIAENVLVYDLGGGTFDVSILNIHGNVFEVKATAGETHLGGEDFDNRMMKTFIDEFRKKYNEDISGNKRALRRLRTECENAKCALSSTMQTFIEIDSLHNGIDFMECVTRIRFEEMCASLFRLTIKIVKGALKDADLKCDDIDTIVLVGGSTRIPKIHQLLQELFKGKKICTTINADEAVARGAAISAALINGGATTQMENMKLMEVTPLTLGVANKRNFKFTSRVIERNTRIPVSRSKIFCTVYNKQTTMALPIVQGERKLAKDNFEIGKLTINGIPAAPAEKEEVKITFSIDENGILTVSAVSQSNADAKGEITITNVCGSLTKAEIDQMVADAETYRKRDKTINQYHTARWDLEKYCVEIKEKYELGKRSIRDKCDEVLSWLNSCYRPSVAQFAQKKNELQALTAKDIKPKIENGSVVDGEDDIEMILLSGNDVIEIDND